MSLRTGLVVVLALAFGGSAAVGVGSLRHPPPGPETVPVVVAAADIPPFAVVAADMVALRDCPKDFVPPGALTKVEDALDRAVFNPLVSGEPVLDAKLAPRGAGRGMAAKIPNGKRAFTIHTPTVEAGVAGFILPGNRVDVLLTLDGGGTKDAAGGSTVTLLQNVEILAIEQRIVPPADSKVDPNQVKSVTLLVTPGEAAKLNLGQTKGKLYLSLRNLSDPEPVSTPPVYASQLSGERPREEPKKEPAEPTRPAVAPPPPPPLRIRTLRGTSEGAVLIQPVPEAGAR